MNRRFVIRLPLDGRVSIYIQLFWIMIMLWLRDVLGLPSAITYVTDVVLIWILVMHIGKIQRENGRAHSRMQTRIFGLILITIVFGVVINLVNPLLVLWAARNNLRFYAFFFISIGLLTIGDVDQIIKMLFAFFWVNVVVCTFQYFVQGLSGDLLGGLFGIETGSNAYVNILLCIVSSVVIGRYFADKASVAYVLIYLVACIYIAMFAELKAFYLEVIVIIAVALFLRGVSWKSFFMCILGVLGIWLLFTVLMIYNPDTVRTILDADAIEAYLAGEGYTQSGDLNRFTAIQQIYTRFFEGQPIKTLFGFGFGNCEVSQFDFLMSDFARQYSYLHYRWFTHAWVFLEQGAVGLTLLVMFFVSLLVTIKKRKKYLRRDLGIASFCFIVTCIFGMIYNCALQLEATYLIAFMCAIPLIASKGARENSGIQENGEAEAVSSGIRKGI